MTRKEANTYSSFDGLLSLEVMKRASGIKYRIYFGKVANKLVKKTFRFYSTESDLGKAIEQMNQIEGVLRSDIQKNNVDRTFKKYKPENFKKLTSIKTYRKYIDKCTELYFQYNDDTESRRIYLRNLVSLLNRKLQPWLHKVVTCDNLEKAILQSTEYGTSNRFMLIKGLRIICKYNKELKEMLRANDFKFAAYSKRDLCKQKPVKIRDVPSDEKILEAAVRFINNKRTITQAHTDAGRGYPPEVWRFAYGMLATYGLRSHELTELLIDRCFINESNTIEISDNTKTGHRIIYPLHKEWVDHFQLRNLIDENKNASILHFLRVKNTRGKGKIAEAFNGRFKHKEMPFNPYDLRHAYAGRGFQLNIPISFMAKSMGHSVEVHERIYQAYLGIEEKNAAFSRAMDKIELEENTKLQSDLVSAKNEHLQSIVEQLQEKLAKAEEEKKLLAAKVALRNLENS